MKNAIKINRVQLLEILSNPKMVNGGTFVGLDLVTIPTLGGGQKNPMQGRVTKLTVGMSVMIFQNKNTNAYENMVERRLVAEGKDPKTFELSPRKWGKRVPNTPIIEHTPKGQTELVRYLEIICLLGGKSTYELDDKAIDKKDILQLKESEGGKQGGLNNKVIIRTPKLDSIIRITIGKQLYIIED